MEETQMTTPLTRITLDATVHEPDREGGPFTFSITEWPECESQKLNWPLVTYHEHSGQFSVHGPFSDLSMTFDAQHLEGFVEQAREALRLKRRYS
jgi:hypothetical protein